MSDRIIGPDSNRYEFPAYPSESSKVNPASKEVFYSHYPYETIKSAKQEDTITVGRVDTLQPSKASAEQLKVPTEAPRASLTDGVAILTGTSAAGGQTYIRRGPEEIFPDRLQRRPELNKDLSVEEENKKAIRGDSHKSTNAGLLAILGRLLVVPMNGTLGFFLKWGSRAVDAFSASAVGVFRASKGLIVGVVSVTEPLWRPVGNRLARALDWLGTQTQNVLSFVSSSVHWLGKTGKQALDALFIESPKAIGTTIRDWWSKFTSWLHS